MEIGEKKAASFKIKDFSLSGALRGLWSIVPVGGSLPEEIWRQRHRFLLGLVWFHAIIIALIGPLLGYSWELNLGAVFRDGTVIHTVWEGFVVAAFALIALWKKGGRAFQATSVAFGLMSSSAILVHLSGGYIEFHFHFFVMLVFLALYQDWTPYLLAILYVALHHGVVGVLWPEEVYNHTAAFNAPWTWAGIHAFFVLWSSVGSVIAWRFNEAAFARTQLILDSAGEGIYGLDREGKITFINPAAAKMLGLNARDVLGQPMEEIMRHPGTSGTAFSYGSSPILTPLTEGSPHQATGELFWRRDGTSFPVDYVSTPILERGELTGVVVTFMDVTVRKQADEKIQSYLGRIAALREIDQAILSTLDLETVLNVLLEKIDRVFPATATTVKLLNRANGLLEPVACRNLDEQEWKLEQQKMKSDVLYAVLESRSPVTIRNVQTDPRVQDPEFFRRHRLFSYLGVPLSIKDDILGVLSFYTREENEFSGEEVEFLSTLAGQAAIAIYHSQVYEEMTTLAGNLARSNRVKDEFLSVISHELRTPLNVVMGYTGLVRDRLLGEINAEQEKALETVMNRANDQLSMINSILQATRFEAEEMKAESHVVRLKDFLDDLQSAYAIHLDKELKLVWDYLPDLPVIQTDGGKLRQILENLINNAIKFTPKGTVTVAARILNGAGSYEAAFAGRNGGRGSGLLQLKVTDTGIGIPQDHFPLIFEKFHQVDSSETRRYGGVGVGLYVVKKFAELLGGRVEIESEPGAGSVFTVTVPCTYTQIEKM